MCSYCGCRSITIIGRFSAEHEEIVNATGRMRRAAERGDLDATRAAVADLTRLLRPHVASEERSLFAELRDDPEFTEQIERLCAEHQEIGAGLTQVTAGDLDGVPAVEKLLRDHIDKEENGVFPAAAITLDGPAWDRVDERDAHPTMSA